MDFKWKQCVYLLPFSSYSKLFVESLPTCIWLLRWGWSRLSFADIFGIGVRRLSCGVVCMILYTFSRFSRTSTCDGRTDGQTDTRRQLIPALATCSVARVKTSQWLLITVTTETASSSWVAPGRKSFTVDGGGRSENRSRVCRQLTSKHSRRSVPDWWTIDRLAGRSRLYTQPTQEKSASVSRRAAVRLPTNKFLRGHLANRNSDSIGRK